MPPTSAPPADARGSRLDALRDAVVERSARLGASRLPVVAWAVVVLAGTAALVAPLVAGTDGLPSWLTDAGAVAVASAFAWGLAARTGGRPLVFGSLGLALGLLVVLVGSEELRTGAAVLTCSVSAVLGVMITVPAGSLLAAVREVVVAVLVAAVGALATVGFAPATTVVAFEYTTFGLAMVGALLVVYRLGAGLHGLGRRGLLTVVVGGLLLALVVTYGELLRRYGADGVVESGLDVVRWSREDLGAFPRPILTVLGVPALAWGCRMRSRRRQGWWVCAFGVAATASVAHGLVNPAVSLTEASLAVLYGVVVGSLLGGLVTRLDLALTGGSTGGSGGRRGGRRAGRRSRAADDAPAVRPEPPRTAPLL